MVEQACTDIHVGDYLKPFEKVNVPLVLRRAPEPTALDPASGKLDRYVVDIQDDADDRRPGQPRHHRRRHRQRRRPRQHLLVYRIIYPSVPSPRNVLGELAVVAVRDRTATAKITYSAMRS